MLRLQGISHHFGGLEVLRNIEFIVAEGELLGLIGPNGAGKTTLFNVITGFVHPQRGRIFFRDRDVTGYPTYRLARLGLVRTFQGARTFANLSVEDCLRVARYHRVAGSDRGGELEKVVRLLDLDKFATGQASSLTAGLARLLGIAMALSTGARLLLLDEPVEGVAPIVVQELGEKIRYLKSLGLTILMAEQNLHFATTISDYAYVIEKGRIRFQGTMQDLSHDDAIKQKYLMI